MAAADEESRVKEEVKGGELLFCGTTAWEAMGRRRTTPEENLVSPTRLRPLMGVDIRFVASGCVSCHCVALDVEGRCYTWGRNEKGQLGHGDKVQRDRPTIVSELSKAVDWRQLADDNFRKRMGNFDRICKQIDEKHDHVMEMLANIQEQLRVLEMNRRKGSRVDFGVANAQSQIQFSSLDQSPKPASKGENEGISNIEVVTGSATISKSSNDTKLENEECVEVLKYVPSIVTVAMEAYYSTTKATEIQEQRVFDEMPESEKLKISDILPPLVLGSEAAEVYNFDVSSPQFQTPLVSTEETKMELECFSVIPSQSSFNSSSDGTKLEDEGFVEVPKYTAVTESQPLASESIFEVFPKLALVASRYINFIGRVETLSCPLFVPVIVEEISFAEKLPNLSIFELIPIWKIMLDTGQYYIVSGCSRDGVALNLIVSWNMMNEMCWDKHILFSGLKLKGFELDLSTIGVVLGFNSRRIADFQMAEVFVNDLSSSTVNTHDHGSVCQFLKDGWSEWGSIKIVARGTNNCEQNSCIEKLITGAFQIQEWVHCMSLYVMNFTCLAFAYDPGICCMCWNDCLVYIPKIQLDNLATSNHQIGLCSVKMVKNVSISHYSLANPTMELEDAVMPLQETSYLHTVCFPTKHVTSRAIRCKARKKEGKELSDEDNHTFDRNFFYHIVVLFYEDGLLVDSKDLADDCEQISLTVGSPPRRKFEYTIRLNDVVFSKNNGNSSFEGDSYGNGALGFEGIHSNLLVNELGEAVRDWEFDDFLPWTTFENGHIIQNSLAVREPIIIQMRERPSPKPPFHCRHVSLGDKTLSTGEYCHALGQSVIWGFTSASYSIPRSCIFT